MSAKRLVILVVPVLFLLSSALAQVNELSVTSGLSFVSTQTVPSTGDPIHFGNASGSVVVDYSRLLMTRKIFGIYAELPVEIGTPMNLNYYYFNQVPKNIGALFVTPSVRVSFFSRDSVTPWVSAGGGYGYFRVSSTTLAGGPNPGGGSNSGVAQFGAGLDVWFWHRWGARFEARDFYSGAPNLNVDTGRSRQHNYYVGAGVGYRF